MPAHGRTLPTQIQGQNVLDDDHTVTIKAQHQHPLVAIFISSTCPCSLSHIAHINELSAKFKDFSFVAILSGAGESKTQALTVFRAMKLTFPVILDADQTILETFAATKTPHAFIVASNGENLFAGGVSDSSTFAQSKKHHLEQALVEISNGKIVTEAEPRALGCYIQRR